MIRPDSTTEGPSALSRTVHPWRSDLARRHPTAYLAAHAIGGSAIVAALIWLFLAVADEFPEHGALAHLDTFATGWLQAHGTETGETIFSVISALGAPVLAVIVAIAFILLLRKRAWAEAAGLACASGGALLLDYLLKSLFHRGRPEFATEFVHTATWSFPSGHAMESLAGYGFLTWLLLPHLHNLTQRRLAVIACVVLVGLIGFSRVYLGVHYVSDVLGGYLAGGAWLLITITGCAFAKLRTSAVPGGAP